MSQPASVVLPGYLQEQKFSPFRFVLPSQMGGGLNSGRGRLNGEGERNKKDYSLRLPGSYQAFLIEKD